MRGLLGGHFFSASFSLSIRHSHSHTSKQLEKGCHQFGGRGGEETGEKELSVVTIERIPGATAESGSAARAPLHSGVKNSMIEREAFK